MKKILTIITIFIFSFLLIGCNKDNLPPNNNSNDVVASYDNDIYYTLFVRSFADSDGDGIGDLNGVTENLEYLSDLGITAIWLLPIFESPSYHGYDTTDYYKINEDYGTMDDLQFLLDSAKEYNIKIVLDLVINHTSDQHPWYKDPAKRSWYSNYQSFDGGMQDLNLDNSEVVSEINKIAKHYLDMGVSGFRLDAVSHFFEEAGPNQALLKNWLFMFNFNKYIKSVKEDAFIVGEVYINDYYIIGEYLKSETSYFNFYLQSQIEEKIARGNNRSLLASNIVRNYNHYYNINNNYVDSPFLGNHDMDRIATIYNNEDKLKQAIQILMTLPGNPFIYYGDELGLKGSRYEGAVIDGRTVYDEYRRQPFLWGNDYTTTWLASDGSNDLTKSLLEQKNNENSLFNFTKAMIQLRKDNPALMDGKEIYLYEQFVNTQSYIRVINNDKFKQAVLVVHNVRNDQVTVDTSLELIYGSKTILANEMAIFEIPFSELSNYVFN